MFELNLLVKIMKNIPGHLLISLNNKKLLTSRKTMQVKKKKTKCTDTHKS